MRMQLDANLWVDARLIMIHRHMIHHSRHNTHKIVLNCWSK